jgi:pyruvate kinase
MRRTKIVATIGPASGSPEMLDRLIDAGMDVARLNFSHGTRSTHARTVERIREASNRQGKPVAILQDLPGPKLRIGDVEGGVAEFTHGARVTMVCGSNGPGNAERLTTSWDGLASTVQPGELVYLADGAVRLRAIACRPEKREVDLEVEIGGTVVPRQGINLPGSTVGLDAVSEDDASDIAFGRSLGVDMVALSFVRSAADVLHARELADAPIIAKIEKPQALEAAEEIIEQADCVMVARGDLGIELELEQVPLAQKRILALAGKRARPSITATQMLESMITNARPTRAEVTDVANAILDGTDAVMLSAETAVGAYPVEAVRMMASIAELTESDLPFKEWNEFRVKTDARDPAYTIAHTVTEAVHSLGLAAIVVPTLTGRSARLVSAHRPPVPVYALSPSEKTVRRCSLMWGIKAAPCRYLTVTEELLGECARRAVAARWVQPGDRIGITAGLPSGSPGTTNLFQVQQL